MQVTFFSGCNIDSTGFLTLQQLKNAAKLLAISASELFLGKLMDAVGQEDGKCSIDSLTSFIWSSSQTNPRTKVVNSSPLKKKRGGASFIIKAYCSGLKEGLCRKIRVHKNISYNDLLTLLNERFNADFVQVCFTIIIVIIVSLMMLLLLLSSSSSSLLLLLLLY